MSCIQFYLYYEKYMKVDRLWLRIYVAFAWALDTAHQVLLIVTVYNYFVKDFGDLTSLMQPKRTLTDIAGVTGFINAMVQFIFVLRIWNLSKGSYVLTGAPVIAILGQLAATLLWFGQIYNFTDFGQLRKVINTERALNVTTAFTDTLIAAVLIYLLRNHRSGFKRTNAIIHRLIMYTIGTGLVTAVWAAAGFIAAIAMPDSFLYLFMDLVVSRLYVNCMFTSLNVRSGLQKGLSNGAQLMSIHLDDLPLRPGGPPRGSAHKDTSHMAVECKVDIDITHESERPNDHKRNDLDTDISSMA